MKGHRPLVYLDDADQERWGLWCLDCEMTHFGFTSELRPSRLAKKHRKETRVEELQEAS